MKAKTPELAIEVQEINVTLSRLIHLKPGLYGEVQDVS
jgi:hypothetical protein